MRTIPTREATVHQQVVNYLRVQYPRVPFRTDMGGVRLTLGQARQAKAMQYKKGWPDIFIAAPRRGWHGLFVELKREGERPILKDGTVSTQEHFAAQNEMLQELGRQGYYATFAIGFDDAKEKIDQYLRDQKA